MSGQVRLSGRLICASVEQSAMVRLYLPEHIRLTRQETGCLFFAVTQSADLLIWQVEEVFADQTAYEAHQKRTRQSEWAEKTAAIRRDYQITADRS